jgi:hypothetical protein
MGILMAARASLSPARRLIYKVFPRVVPGDLARHGKTRLTPPTTPDKRCIGKLSTFLKDDGNDPAKGGGRIKTVFSFQFSVKRNNNINILNIGIVAFESESGLVAAIL